MNMANSTGNTNLATDSGFMSNPNTTISINLIFLIISRFKHREFKLYNILSNAWIIQLSCK